MSTESEATARTEESWLSTLSEARKNCRLRVGEAAQAVDDPYRAHWPPRARSNTPHAKVKKAHLATIDYCDQVRPYVTAADEDDKEHELWEEQLGTVDVNGSEIEVSLAAIEDLWESKFIHFTSKEQDELKGKKQEQTKLRLLLPVQVARQCYRQLNDIVVELGFAPEAPGGEQRTEITDELMEDVEEWRQQHLEQ